MKRWLLVAAFVTDAHVRPAEPQVEVTQPDRPVRLAPVLRHTARTFKARLLAPVQASQSRPETRRPSLPSDADMMVRELSNELLDDVLAGQPVDVEAYVDGLLEIRGEEAR
jgi:hypothetical protein